MEVIQLVFNAFGENTYIVADISSRECAIIDPGMSDKREQTAFIQAIERNHLKPVHLINTHLHIDHVLGNKFIASNYGLTIEANNEDAFLGSRIVEQARMFGLPGDADNCAIETFLNDGDEIRIGNSLLKVLGVPGHSPGSIALYDKDSHFVITGDALFAGSIGRTDLPGGDYATLIGSITQKLMKLPEDTIVYPGHGPATTIGKEKTQNPYL